MEMMKGDYLVLGLCTHEWVMELLTPKIALSSYQLSIHCQLLHETIVHLVAYPQ